MTQGAAMATASVSAKSDDLQRVSELLGGSAVLSKRVSTALELHELILEGLPASALDHLVDQLRVLGRTDSLEKAVGMSVRTHQRRRADLSKPLGREQSGRAWKFAEILTRATDIFGSQEEAEHWLERPALAFDGYRPLDLLSTLAGAEMVDDHLVRLEYGVYT
jgi:putative toxin-antitoxin system antitoxin component (TIGR02293 family)